MFNFFKKPTLKYFNVNIVDHCNLNCKYCDHFAPLAEEKYVDIDNLERDFRRIAYLVKLDALGLMGGEPLLHPQLPEILNMSRRIFPHTRISIFTNAILLDKQNEVFWKACRKNNINIGISRYPINIDFNTIFSISKENNVNVFLYSGTVNSPKTMFKLGLDLQGTQNAAEMSKICWQNKGGCSFLGDGKFYQCTTAGQIHRLIKYFNLDIKVTDEDYIDIYKIRKGQEIIDFYKKVIPFCKYCDIKKQISGLKFEISKKELSEWV